MDIWAWLALLGLGAFHGVNPAMGWLFAVALGLHRRSRAVVVLSLIPIALGHAAAVGLAVAVLAAAGTVLHLPALHGVAGGLLMAWGVYHVIRGHRHRLRVGMTAGFAGLALWSFLVATAHGAGFMLAPVVLEGGAGQAHHGDGIAAPATLLMAMGTVAVHTLAMAATATVVAIAIYEWLGLAVLRQAWFNLDRLWAAALIGAGALLVISW